MKKALLGVCAAMCLLLSSCAFSNNLTSNANELQTQVVLQKKNYKREFGIRDTSKKVESAAEKVADSFGNVIDI